MRPERARGVPAVALLLVIAVGACGPGDSELARTHRYMDSLRVYLGELRVMDHELNKVVQTDTVRSEIVVPLIADRFRPTVARLRERANALDVTGDVSTAQRLLLSYLEVRLQAYDAAIQGQAESRPELFGLFARKQVEADTLGRTLENEVSRLRTTVAGYH